MLFSMRSHAQRHYKVRSLGRIWFPSGCRSLSAAFALLSCLTPATSILTPGVELPEPQTAADVQVADFAFASVSHATGNRTRDRHSTRAVQLLHQVASDATASHPA